MPILIMKPMSFRQGNNETSSSSPLTPLQLDDLLTNAYALENSLLDTSYAHANSSNNGNHRLGVLDPEMLPSKQRLELRLRDYYRRVKPTLPAHMSPGPALDRFRDIPPALVLAVFEGDMAIIEPGSIGPLPLGHTIIQELIDCINRRFVSPAILSIVLMEEKGGGEEEPQVNVEGDDNEDINKTNGSSKLYDGGLMVGVLDYRTSCSFAVFSSLSNGVSQSKGLPPSSPHGLLSAMTTQGVAPEMHKVFLRPTYASMAPFMDEANESDCLLALYPSIVVDPSPTCWQAMEWALYERDKIAVHCSGLLKNYPNVAGQRCQSNAQSEPLPLGKVKLLAAIEESRARRAAGSAEAFLGIDQRRNLARCRSNIPTTVMNNPNQRVWRTVRFEREQEDSIGKTKRTHYSVNILAVSGGSFEVILRRGSAPDTAQGVSGFTQRFTLPTLAAVELYLSHLKHLLAMEDYKLKLTVDVANPAVLTTGGTGLSIHSVSGQSIMSTQNIRINQT